MGGFIIAPDAAWGWLVPALFVYGFGVGLATAQLTGVILQDVPVQLSGQGSGTQSTSRQVGSALGVAILGTVLFTTTGAALSASLDDAGVPAAQADTVVSAVVDSAGGAIAGLSANPETEAFGAAAEAAFSDGTRASAFTAAGFLLVGLAATFSLGAGRRQEGRAGLGGPGAPVHLTSRQKRFGPSGSVSGSSGFGANGSVGFGASGSDGYGASGSSGAPGSPGSGGPAGPGVSPGASGKAVLMACSSHAQMRVPPHPHPEHRAQPSPLTSSAYSTG